MFLRCRSAGDAVAEAAGCGACDLNGPMADTAMPRPTVSGNTRQSIRRMLDLTRNRAVRYPIFSTLARTIRLPIDVLPSTAADYELRPRARPRLSGSRLLELVRFMAILKPSAPRRPWSAAAGPRRVAAWLDGHGRRAGLGRIEGAVRLTIPHTRRAGFRRLRTAAGQPTRTAARHRVGRRRFHPGPARGEGSARDPYAG